MGGLQSKKDDEDDPETPVNSTGAKISAFRPSSGEPFHLEKLCHRGAAICTPLLRSEECIVDVQHAKGVLQG